MEDANAAIQLGRLDEAEAVLDQYFAKHQPKADSSFFYACLTRAALALIRGPSAKLIVEKMLKALRGDDEDTAMRRLSVHRYAAVLYVEGTELISKRAYVSARLKFDEILRVNPDFVLAHLGLATVNYMYGNYQKAFQEYATVLQLAGNSAPLIVRVGLALCAFQLKCFDHARLCIERALELDSNDPQALMAAIVIFLRERDLARASELITRLYKKLNDRPIVVQKWADVLFFKVLVTAQLETAYPLVQEAIERAIPRPGEAPPSLSGYAKFQQARLYHALGQLEEAEGLYRAALSAVQHLTSAKVNLARIAWKAGRRNEALNLLLDAQQAAPLDKEPLHLLCLFYSQSKPPRHEYAVRLASQLTDSIAPGDVASWEIAAFCSRLNRESCSETMHHVVRLRSELGLQADPRLQLNIAAAASNVNFINDYMVSTYETSDASTLAAREIALQDVPAYYNFALALETLDPQSAKTLYIALVRQHPGLLLPFFRLHKMALREGNRNAAVAWLTLLWKIEPQNPHVHCAISRVYYEAGSPHNAFEVLRTKESERCTHNALAQGILFLSDAQKTSPGQPPKTRSVEYALDRFRYVLRTEPGNIIAAHGVAVCTALKKNVNRATIFFERVVEAKAVDPVAKSNVVGNLFNALVEIQSYKQAISLSARHEMSERSLPALAFCYAHDGQFDVAIEILEKKLALCKQDIPKDVCQFNLAIILLASVYHRLSNSAPFTEAEGERLKKCVQWAIELEEDVRAAPLYKDPAVRRVCRSLREHGRTLNLSLLPKIVSKGAREAHQSALFAEEWKQSATLRRHREQFEQQHALRELEEEQRVAEQRMGDQMARIRELRSRWEHQTAPEGVPVDEEAVGAPTQEVESMMSRGRKRTRDGEEVQLDIESLEELLNAGPVGMELLNAGPVGIPEGNEQLPQTLVVDPNATTQEGQSGGTQ